MSLNWGAGAEVDLTWYVMGLHVFRLGGAKETFVSIMLFCIEASLCCFVGHVESY